MWVLVVLPSNSRLVGHVSPVADRFFVGIVHFFELKPCIIELELYVVEEEAVLYSRQNNQA